MRNPVLPRNVTIANEKLEPGMYTYRLGRKKFHGQSVGQVREVTRRLYSDERTIRRSLGGRTFLRAACVIRFYESNMRVPMSRTSWINPKVRATRNSESNSTFLFEGRFVRWVSSVPKCVSILFNVKCLEVCLLIWNVTKVKAISSVILKQRARGR